jgi:signal peptide peptidase SppA
MQNFYRLSGVFKVRVSGLITSKTYEKLSKDLKNFNSIRPLALLVSVNSPGGSASDSDQIFKALRSFAELHKIPVHSFGEEVAASGGYYIMCAGDSLHANSSLSLFGSIGSVSLIPNVKTLAGKLGIERRAWSSNSFEFTSLTDPLSTYSDDKSKKIKSILNEIQTGFIAVVSERRKGKLVENKKNDGIFNGNVFHASEAVELGLIDGKESPEDLVKRLYPKSRVYDLSKKDWLESCKDKMLFR